MHVGVWFSFYVNYATKFEYSVPSRTRWLFICKLHGTKLLPSLSLKRTWNWLNYSTHIQVEMSSMQLWLSNPSWKWVHVIDGQSFCYIQAFLYIVNTGTSWRLTICVSATVVGLSALLNYIHSLPTSPKHHLCTEMSAQISLCMYLLHDKVRRGVYVKHDAEPHW